MLGLLYFGREVLVPITLAVILSLLIAPLVRKLRRFVRSQVPAVLGAVFVLTLLVGGLARGDRLAGGGDGREPAAVRDRRSATS